MLVLFDIDGTLLLKAFAEHRQALDAALRRVYGIDVPDTRIEAAGRTDGAIARSVLTLAGVPAERIDERAGEFRAVCCEEYAHRCPADLSGAIAPGVIDALEALAARDDVRLSLVTGNLEPIARLKLARSGLGRFFPRGQGGFGSDHEDRAALPAIARRRAALDGRPWPRKRTVVVGDTPRDIACAQADGVACVAIATGPFAADQLTDAAAVLPDASTLVPTLETLGLLRSGSAACT